ncbi:hypothetical protein VTH06DRAFT_2299 [Thermothelomyces fergusii]
MGFVTGFAGGVTLTLSLTYLALLTHASNRQAQSAILRSQASAIDGLIPPEDDYLGRRRRRNATVPLPDGTYRPRESLEQYRRDVAGGDARASLSFIETAKTRWNSEILSAVRWAQNKDWSRVREQAEDKVAALLGLELSREPITVEEVAMRDEARDIVSEAREVVAVGVHEAREAVEKGVEKAHDLAEKTKAAVHLAEERADSEVYAKLLPVSDIEKALAERYDSALREERMKRSVEEVLRERYLPLDKRDNSRLRGL